MKIRTARKPPASVTWGVVSSPVGNVLLGMTPSNEICCLSFLKRQTVSGAIDYWRRRWPQTQFKKTPTLKKKILDFAAKDVFICGTDFQTAVWRCIAAIPCGKTMTYSAIASKLGDKKAARAVGTACGANPVPYLVPCHRVVGVSGLGGFSGGLDLKKALLKSEKK